MEKNKPNIISKLISSRELIYRSKPNNSGYIFVRDKTGTHLITDIKKPCTTCGNLTNRLEICSEGYFCDEKCENIFYDKVKQHEIDSIEMENEL